MPSPGSLRHLERKHRPFTLAEIDRVLERLADLARAPSPVVRAQALKRCDVWLDERNRATERAA